MDRALLSSHHYRPPPPVPAHVYILIYNERVCPAELPLICCWGEGLGPMTRGTYRWLTDLHARCGSEVIQPSPEPTLSMRSRISGSSLPGSSANKREACECSHPAWWSSFYFIYLKLSSVVGTQKTFLPVCFHGKIVSSSNQWALTVMERNE